MIRHEIIVLEKRAAYWERGVPTDPTIVLMHGFRGNHKGLTDFAQELDGFHLIIPDLPGYGESEPLDEAHTMAAYARWLDEFVRALGLKTWYSWSHSYSGSIALIQAATGAHRPAGMISVSLAVLRPGLGRSITAWYYRVGARLPAALGRRWILNRTVDRLAVGALFTTASAKRRGEILDRNDRDMNLLHPRVITEQFMSSLELNLDDYARRVEVPVLVIAGARDYIAPVAGLKRLMDLMARGELVVLEDQGHLAPLERPARTAAITAEWIGNI